MFTDVFQAVILANALSFAVIYGMWRIVKNERDIKGILWAVIPALIVALLAYRPM